MTVMWFDAPEGLSAFGGPDAELAVVPEAARRVLKRFDARSAHFELRETQSPT